MNTTELKLRQVGGPAIAPEGLTLGDAASVGRSSQADLHLDDPAVSRRHAELRPTESGWILIDSSTHGTYVNDVRLDKGLPYPLKGGDLLRFGAWIFEVLGEGEPAPAQTIITDGGRMSTRTRRASLFDRSRVRALGELSERLSGARDDKAIAEAMLEAALHSSQFQWGVVVRPPREDRQPEVIAGAHVPDSAVISRTLLSQAGEALAVLELGPTSTPDSLIGSETRSAIAAPVGGWRIYLSSSASSEPIDDAYAAYVEVVTRLGALALSDRRRRDLERRHSQYTEELAAARRVQERFLPGVDEQMGSWRVDSVSAPGTGMAGDILGAVAGGDGSLTVFIGDVVGKGSAASIVMTAAQSYLEARLRCGEPLTEVVSSLNRFIAGRTLGAEFLTLWMGRITGGNIEYVDAGHGYAHRVGVGSVSKLNAAGGIPVGIDGEAPYESRTEPFEPGDMLMLCSDGVIEQRNRAGEEFTADRLEGLLQRDGASLTTGALLDAVRAFADREALDDDFTACIVRRAEEEA